MTYQHPGKVPVILVRF